MERKEKNNNSRMQQNVKEIECAGRKVTCRMEGENIEAVWFSKYQYWKTGEDWMFQECAGMPFLIFKDYEEYAIFDIANQRVIEDRHQLFLQECAGKAYICYTDYIPKSEKIREIYDVTKDTYIMRREESHSLELKEVKDRAFIIEKHASGKIVAVKCDEDDITTLLYEFLEHYEERYSLKKFLYNYLIHFFTKK